MEKKTYHQPLTQNKLVGFSLPVAQLPVGSNEHEDQWSKDREEDIEFIPDEELQEVEYGNLW